MLSPHSSSQIQLGLNHLVLRALQNGSQLLPTTDEDAPVRRNLEAEVRPSAVREGNSREGVPGATFFFFKKEIK